MKPKKGNQIANQPIQKNFIARVSYLIIHRGVRISWGDRGGHGPPKLSGPEFCRAQNPKKKIKKSIINEEKMKEKNILLERGEKGVTV